MEVNTPRRVPERSTARAPDLAGLAKLPLSAFAPTILYSNGEMGPEGPPICQTASFTPARPSFAVIRVDVDFKGNSTTSRTFTVEPGYSTTNGDSYHAATPHWWTVATSALGARASAGNSGVVRLAAGQAYRFAAKMDIGGPPSPADCIVVVEILPKFPGSKIIGPCGKAVCPNIPTDAKPFAGR
jgi:hypothetical protein